MSDHPPAWVRHRLLHGCACRDKSLRMSPCSRRRGSPPISPLWTPLTLTGVGDACGHTGLLIRKTVFSTSATRRQSPSQRTIPRHSARPLPAYVTGRASASRYRHGSGGNCPTRNYSSVSTRRKSSSAGQLARMSTALMSTARAWALSCTPSHRSDVCNSQASHTSVRLRSYWAWKPPLPPSFRSYWACIPKLLGLSYISPIFIGPILFNKRVPTRDVSSSYSTSWAATTTQ